MNTIKTLPDRLLGLVIEILNKSGIDSDEASIIANNMVWTDLVGRNTHGIWRLNAYLKRFNHGLINSPCKPFITQKSKAIHIITGNNGFGQYLGHIAMLKAISIAKQFGIGVVGVCNSNHFGIGAYYVNLATENSQIGIAVSNSVPKVAPFGGISPVFGTNPFSFGAPTRNGRSILIDFSTGASAGSLIIKAIEENKNIPEGIIIDEEGNSIIDPKKSSKGAVLPFGGVKGYCMGLMIEILSGVITGAAISHEVASMYNNFDRASNVGHLFIALDIAQIMPLDKYYDRMLKLIEFVKASKTLKGVDKVLIPGEPQWQLFEKQKKDGILLDKETINTLTKLADELGISTPW